MPTFREDLHLGHKVPTVETDDIVNRAITSDKIALLAIVTDLIADLAVTADKLADGAVTTPKLKNLAVTTSKLADLAVTTSKIANKAVTPEKISADFKSKVILPITDSIDHKYDAITNELYSMIRSLQVGGIALSGKFGNREDIGITQKALTKAIGYLWDKIGEITGEAYMDFVLTVEPVATYSESSVTVNITADSTDSISDFDTIKIYVDDVLVAESHDTATFITSHTISQTAVVKAVGVILGRTITKQAVAVNEAPFFIGSGNVYTDIMNEDCRRTIDGTIEGDYDVTVGNDGDKLFVIIPISTRSMFRRADMNGYEIPFMDSPVVTDEYVVYESVNQYQAGTYNVDIDINS